MAEESEILAPAGSEPEEKDELPSRWSRLRALPEELKRFEKSAAARYWSHLSAADFMNSSFAFSALAVLSAFPFLSRSLPPHSEETSEARSSREWG
jgi:hypothetical protein